MKDVTGVLMHRVPKNLDVTRVVDYLLQRSVSGFSFFYSGENFYSGSETSSRAPNMATIARQSYMHVSRRCGSS